MCEQLKNYLYSLLSIHRIALMTLWMILILGLLLPGCNGNSPEKGFVRTAVLKHFTIDTPTAWTRVKGDSAKTNTTTHKPFSADINMKSEQPWLVSGGQGTFIVSELTSPGENATPDTIADEFISEFKKRIAVSQNDLKEQSYTMGDLEIDHFRFDSSDTVFTKIVIRDNKRTNKVIVMDHVCSPAAFPTEGPLLQKVLESLR